MAQVLKMRFLVRCRTAAEWTAVNEVLLMSTEGTGAREMGVEIDTGRFKLGDGVTAWNDLPYTSSSSSPVAGEGIEIDDTDPQHPVISSSLAAVALTDRVDSYADLPTGLGSGDKGKAYLNTEDNLIYVWNGSAFQGEGQGYGGASGGSQAALSAALMALGPKVYYKCDEAAGSTVLHDSSGNGMDLAIQGACILDQFELVPGGGSFACPTSSSANVAYRAGTSGFAVPINYDYTQFVVLMLITSTNQPVLVFEIAGVGETAPTNVQAELELNNITSGIYGATAFWEHGSGTNDQINGPICPNGVPFSLAVRKNTAAKTVDFFINGQPVYSNTYTSEPTGGTTADTYLGASTSGTSVAYFLGSNFAMFDRGLTDAEIRKASKAGGFK